MVAQPWAHKPHLCLLSISTPGRWLALPACLNPRPGSGFLGPAGDNRRGPGRPEGQQLPSLLPRASCQDQHPVSEPGPVPRVVLTVSGRQGQAGRFLPGAGPCSPPPPSPDPCPQPPAASAPRGAPEHGDRGLPEELPALPHHRGPPHVLPASPRPGPGHRRSLLPPQLPGPAPLPPPGLQVRRPRASPHMPLWPGLCSHVLGQTVGESAEQPAPALPRRPRSCPGAESPAV